MKISILSIASITLLISCTSVEKPIEVQTTENSPFEYEFVVAQNYQSVYRKLLKQARDCVKPGLTSQMVVQGSLFNELQAADITVVLYGIFSRYPHLKINIEAVDSDTAKISVSNKLPRWNSYARAVKQWVDGDLTRCIVEE